MERSRIFHPAFFVILLFAVVFFSFSTVRPAYAAIKTWDGGGADTNWATCENWNGDTCPGAGDIATFDGTSTKNALITTSISVAGVDINAGYTGTITLDATGTLAVGTSNFDMATGTFTANSGSILDINQHFILSGGSFTAPTTMTVAGSWTHTAGGTFAHNNGTVSLDGGINGTIDVATSETFYNFTFAKTGGFDLFTSAGDTLLVLGATSLAPSVSTSTMNANATLEMRGSVTVQSGLTAIGAIALEFTGTSAQTLDATGSEGAMDGAITVNKAGDTLTLLSSITLNAGGQDFFLESGTINANGNSITVADDFNQSGGSFLGGSGSLTTLDFILSSGTFTAPTTTNVSGNWTHTAGGTFTHNNKTVNFNGSAAATTIDVATSETFYNFTFSKGGGWDLTLSAGDTISVIALTDLAPLSTGSVINGSGILQLQGNLSLVTGMTATITAPISFAGTATQTVSLTGSEGAINSDITIEKTSGSVQLLSQLTLDGSNQDLVLSTSGSTLNLNGFDLTVNGTGSTMTLASGTNLTLFGSETITTLGSYPTLSSGSTVKYTGTSGPYTLKNFTYHHLEINGGAASVFTLAEAETIAGNLTINAGILSQGGFDLEVTGTFSNLATLRRLQTETFTGTMDTNSGTVEYVGDGDGSSESVSLADFGTPDYFILKINDTNGTQDTFTIDSSIQVSTVQVTSSSLALGSSALTTNTFTVDGGTFSGGTGTLDINQHLTISSGTFTAPNASGSFTIQGNISLSGGTFAHNSGLAILDPNTNHTITGDITWNSLTMLDNTNNASDTVLTLEALSTQTFAGILTLDGLDATDRLNIVSSTPSSAATILFSGTSSFVGDYLDIQDSTVTDSSTNVSTPIDPENSTDSGNTTNWFTPPVVLDSITISDNSGYTNDTTPIMTLVESGAEPTEIAFSCNGGSNWSSWLTYPDDNVVNDEDGPAFDITTGATGCSATNELKTITAKLRNISVESSTASDTTTYDSVAPTVTNVTATNANGTYGSGTVLTSTVEFIEIVTVSGIPQLELDFDGTDRQADYTTGTGSTTLSFAYTVVNGDNTSDLDYTGVNALTLNGGTITDRAGNTATRTLASPGAAGSLGANKNIVISTNQAPTVSLVTGVQQTDGSGDVTITFAIDDPDNDDVIQAKIEYSITSGASWEDPTLSTTNEETSATYGDPTINNLATYQVGQSGAYIITSSGENTVSIVWNAATDLPSSTNISTTQIRVTPYDSTIEGSSASSSTFALDFVAPDSPSSFTYGALAAAYSSFYWSAGTDTNFDHYEIWYASSRTDAENRTGSAVKWDDTDDGALTSASTTTTNILAYTRGKFAVLFAVDTGGNTSASSTLFVPHPKRTVSNEPTYAVTLTSPKAQSLYSTHTPITIQWEVSGTGSASFANIFWSSDNQNYIPIANHIDAREGTYFWIPPSAAQGQITLYIEITDLANLLASDTGESITISSTSSAPPPEETSPTQEETTTPPSFIKGVSWDTVYAIYGTTRKPFLNATTFFTYENDFSRVSIVPDAVLSTYTIGTPMLPKAQTTLLKIESVPHVYFTDSTGDLRWIASEEIAQTLFGNAWSEYVIDIPVTAWTYFTFGNPIQTPADLSPDNALLKKRNELGVFAQKQP